MSAQAQLEMWDADPQDHLGLPACGWSRSVALDPRHRPQVLDRPSSTVRREWCRGPQEAHLLDRQNRRYRQFTWQEIALLQGFDPSWFDVEGLTKSDRIRAIGDAVPPPLAKAVVRAIEAIWTWEHSTAIEICAGAGGLASASSEALEHLALIDSWPVSSELLRHGKPWSAGAVRCERVDAVDWTDFRREVGLLSGGPPCQPWSQGGRRRGIKDPRDLLGVIHEVLAEIEPEAFVFENVPGLTTTENRDYFREILENMRRPTSHLRYGVMAGIFNAADFGVPQTRRRVFFVGLRDRPNADAHRTLDLVASARTHRSPTISDPSRTPWRTVGDVLEGREDPGGWRRWIDDSASLDSIVA